MRDAVTGVPVRCRAGRGWSAYCERQALSVEQALAKEKAPVNKNGLKVHFDGNGSRSSRRILLVTTPVALFN